MLNNPTFLIMHLRYKPTDLVLVKCRNSMAKRVALECKFWYTLRGWFCLAYNNYTSKEALWGLFCLKKMGSDNWVHFFKWGYYVTAPVNPFLARNPKIRFPFPDHISAEFVRQGRAVVRFQPCTAPLSIWCALFLLQIPPQFINDRVFQTRQNCLQLCLPFFYEINSMTAGTTTTKSSMPIVTRLAA